MAGGESSLISNASLKDQFGHRTYYFFSSLRGVRFHSGFPHLSVRSNRETWAPQ
jgi:hypothetical protein